MPEYTHIRLTPGTRDRLRSLKEGKDEYEDVVKRLIESWRIVRRAGRPDVEHAGAGS